MASGLDEKPFSAVPFWFWNGDQNEDEIVRQLRLANEGGLRGMAIHARSGNKTEYMSERWLALVRFACVEARRLGLEIWIYDDDGFPSGQAGGRLPARGEFYRQKALSFARQTASEAAADPALVRAFAYRDLSRAVNPAELPPNAEVLAFSLSLNPHMGMIDYLNREVCEEFLRMTHEKYAAALGEFFGNPITMFYTDDLNHMLRSGPHFSYTPGLEDEFVSEHGYSLLENLPKLVEDLENASKVRIDYRKTLLRMFIENFVEPMAEWCHRHGLLLTGHLSGDEGPMLVEVNNYTDPMAFYEVLDVPGVDDFLAGNHTMRYLSTPVNSVWGRISDQTGFPMLVLCKKASSVASQLKNGRCSSEVLTSLGWGVPVAAQIAQLQVQLGLGINVIVPHACSYSTAGETKRDNPASYFFQQPYYRYNRELQRSITRSLSLLTRGRVDAGTLIVYPIRSLWLLLNGTVRDNRYRPVCPIHGERTVQYYTDLISELCLKLQNFHVDYEFGSEEIIERHGLVDNAVFQVGNASYRTVILPDVLTLSAKVLELLDIFDANGGRIIRIGEGGRWRNSVIVPDCKAMRADLFTPSLEFEPADGCSTDEILLNTRIMNENQEYFLVNFSGKSQTVKVKKPGYELFDPLTGTLVRRNGRVPEVFVLREFHSCHWLPAGTVDAPVKEIGETLFSTAPVIKRIAIGGSWKITPAQDNILVVDHAVNSNGVRLRFSSMRYFNLPLHSVFYSTFNLPGKIDSVILLFEPGNIDRVTVNGQPLHGCAVMKHSATQELTGYEIAALLKAGTNRIDFRNLAPRLECLYLAGNFQVATHREETEIFFREQPLTFGNLAESGYPFYWGDFYYETDFELFSCPGHDRMFLWVSEAEGVVKAVVNGIELPALYGGPWEFPVSGLLRKGKNHIKLIIVNTAQNFFGPHRWEGVQHGMLTAWRPMGSVLSPESFQLPGFGIFAAPEILIRS